MKQLVITVVMCGLFLSGINSFGQSNYKDIINILLSNLRWEGETWNISAIKKRDLVEGEAVGQLKEVDLNLFLSDFQANTGLPDSVSFIELVSFPVGYFSGKFWAGSSNETVHWKTYSGVWNISKGELIWESPDESRLPQVCKITNIKKNSFNIEGQIDFEAFEYFEYIVEYSKEKN